MSKVYQNRNYSSRNFLKFSVEISSPLEEKIVILDCSPHWALIGEDVVGSIFIYKKDSSLRFFRIGHSNELIYIDSKILNNGSQVKDKDEVLLFFSNEKKIRFYDKNFQIIRDIPLEVYPTHSDGTNLYIIDSEVENSFIIKKIAYTGELIWETTRPFGGKFIGVTPNHILLNGDNFWNELDPKNRSIICLSQKDGSVVWQTYIEGLVRNPVLIAENAIIVESQLDGIVCLDLKSGAVLWTFKKLSFQNCRKYTLDYDELLHLFEFDVYYQINMINGRVIKEFPLTSEYNRLKLNSTLFNPGSEDSLNFFGASNFQPTVTSEHFIIAVFQNLLFVNKNSGIVDYMYTLRERNSIISEMAIIDNYRLLIISSVFNSKIKGNVMRILESINKNVS